MDIETGNCCQAFQVHGSKILTFAFCPDGHFIATGSSDATVRLWDVTTGECCQVFAGHTSRILAIAYSPDGCLIASSSVDKTVKLWDVHTGICSKVLLGYKGEVTSVAFSPDKMFIPRPYEGMNITGVTGLTSAELATLKALGVQCD